MSDRLPDYHCPSCDTDCIHCFCSECFECGKFIQRERIIELLQSIPLEAIYLAVYNCLDETGVFDHDAALAEKKKLIAFIETNYSIKGEQK